MSTLDVRRVRIDVAQAEHRLGDVEKIYGKGSEPYREALKQLTRLWLVLRLRQRPENFLPEVSQG